MVQQAQVITMSLGVAVHLAPWGKGPRNHPRGLSMTHGADRDDLARLARASAYEAVFGLLYRLTAHGQDDEAPDNSPGWRLMETTATGELTGRAVRSLHEDLLGMDPSGREGQDLFE
ncbi:hypothetical protein [Nonomuraea sp. NPDC049684]|uniref:hypothetical protein n=1 Tax=Nonomuraea sp. NPDC049684 TaxID=3364356 RepID=UPI0037A4FD26